MDTNGWFRIHRKISDWGWRKDPITFSVFVHLLAMANYHESEFMGHKIEIGQAVIGRLSISEAIGISEQSVRTALKRLKSTKEITIKSTKRFSIVTIINYCKYQDKDDASQPNIQPDNQHSTNQLLTTSKNLKEVKNKIYDHIEIDHHVETDPPLDPNLHPSPLAPKGLKRKKQELKPYPEPTSRTWLTPIEVTALTMQMGQGALEYQAYRLHDYLDTPKGKKAGFVDHHLVLSRWHNEELKKGYKWIVDGPNGTGYRPVWLTEKYNN